MKQKRRLVEMNGQRPGMISSESFESHASTYSLGDTGSGSFDDGKSLDRRSSVGTLDQLAAVLESPPFEPEEV